VRDGKTAAEGYFDTVPCSLIDTLYRRAKLWSRIVRHAGPRQAWTICAKAHPWREAVTKWVIITVM